jgi:hypothetical protein
MHLHTRQAKWDRPERRLADEESVWSAGEWEKGLLSFCAEAGVNMRTTHVYFASR